ncbi:caspase family protein [Longimicrobium sp.]|uniref:caspase family protein n=1 Tax=Longimicrobium sp. TaxID=2029185 RepID=UPI002B731A83|nr:caspase family protein [Longimicrobium sp.]HSU17446.1 caspase family protein [Longimicrobium sp.]
MNWDDHAVIVGINRYPGLRDLQGAENDARAFENWIRQSARVPAENVKMILSSQFPQPLKPQDARPMVSEIDMVFDNIIERSEELGFGGRRLYMFFAGHGFARTYEDASLLTAEARPRSTGFHIPARDYANWFRASGYFQEIVLIMDCCRESYITAPARPVPWEPKVDRRGTSVRYAFAFATRWSMESREKFIARFSEIRGIFTVALLEGLSGAAATTSSSITTERLDTFVHQYMPELCAPSEYIEPRFEYDRRNDIILVESETPRSLTRVHTDCWAIELYDHRNMLIDLYPSRTEANVWEQELTPGLYVLRCDRKPDKVIQVTGTEEQNVDF